MGYLLLMNPLSFPMVFEKEDEEQRRIIEVLKEMTCDLHLERRAKQSAGR